MIEYVDSHGNVLGKYEITLIPRVEDMVKLGNEHYVVGDVFYDFDEVEKDTGIPAVVVTLFSMEEVEAVTGDIKA